MTRPAREPMTPATLSAMTTIGRTARTARLTPGRRHTRQATRLPGQLPDRSPAVTARILAAAAARRPPPGHRIWPRTGNRPAEPGRIAPQATILATRPPGKPAGEQAAARPPGHKAVGP